jgi:hypothetical protein
LVPVLVMAQRVFADTTFRSEFWTRVFRVVVGIVPVALSLVGGFFVAAGSQTGLFLVAATIALVFVTSMLNAWVLLVEVQR